MDNEQKVLHSPFDIETHKKTFINYLEVIIDTNGIVHYAVPSHQEWLINKICIAKNLTKDNVFDSCPNTSDFVRDYLIPESGGCIPVWNEYYMGEPNKSQRETLTILKQEGLYTGEIR